MSIVGPLYVHCGPIICPLWAHYMSIVSPLYVHCRPVIYPLWAHYMSIVGPLYVHCRPTICPLLAHYIYTSSCYNRKKLLTNICKKASLAAIKFSPFFESSVHVTWWHDSVIVAKRRAWHINRHERIILLDLDMP